jgi:hypothetical protein
VMFDFLATGPECVYLKMVLRINCCIFTSDHIVGIVTFCGVDMLWYGHTQFKDINCCFFTSDHIVGIVTFCGVDMLWYGHTQFKDINCYCQAQL